MTKEVGAVALADLMRFKRLRLLDDDFMKVCFQDNVEVQRKTKGARPRRARYHASLLDAGSIRSGKDTELMKVMTRWGI
ncbi:MAG: hypothetical protein IJ324_11575 [Lachnospiraceae bacterium]|nr:hypothetical protein [Lachnospiraceae bacterium]